MAELVVEAQRDRLDQVLQFVNEHLEEAGCERNVQVQIDIAVEEIFVNIASHAYHNRRGEAVVRVELTQDPLQIAIQFLDRGKPFNPLEHEDPDITLSSEERGIGGLGIYLVRRSMDQVEYRYEGTRNILTIKKKLSQEENRENSRNLKEKQGGTRGVCT